MGGWRTMEFNRVELDAKAAHFEVHNSYFKVKHAGIYRICLWTIHYGLGGIRYMVRINGANMMSEGHSEGGDRYGGRRGWWRWYWEDTHIDQTGTSRSTRRSRFGCTPLATRSTATPPETRTTVCRSPLLVKTRKTSGCKKNLKPCLLFVFPFILNYN